jgi:exopolysaccharide production protein ExoQ
MRTVVLSSFVHRLLHIIIFLFIPIAIMAPHVVVWEIIIGGLIGLYYSRKQSLTQISLPLTIILLMIPLWALVTTLWAKYPLSSLTTSLKVLALVILGLYWCRLTLSLPQQTRKSLITALIAGFFFGILFLVGDIWLKNPWQNFWQKTSAKALAQGSLLISLVAWPMILWTLRRPYSIYGRIGLLVFALGLIFWTLFQIDCDTSFIGLFMGICVFFGTLLLPRMASFGMRLFVPIIIISFPFISLFAFKPEHIPTYNRYLHDSSFIDRLYIWNDVATSILDHPWKGIGMDGTRHHEKTKILREWSVTNKAGGVSKFQTQHFGVHPHNAILQLWLELGFLGFILGILLACQVLRQIYCTNLLLAEKAVSSGLFTGAFLVVWVNLGFWQNWWISALWIIVGLTISLFKGTGEISEKVDA